MCPDKCFTTAILHKNVKLSILISWRVQKVKKTLEDNPMREILFFFNPIDTEEVLGLYFIQVICRV